MKERGGKEKTVERNGGMQEEERKRQGRKEVRKERR